jgi:carbon-monoxide dehydrogenase medium subunit
MIPKEFAYAAPASLDEALGLLGQHGDEAKILAGGHSLIPLMKLRLAEPGLLVDLRRLSDLRGIDRAGDGGASIGALTTHAELAREAGKGGALGLLGECAAQIGDAQVRNRGTIGGSLAHGDPAADLPAVILALDAELEAAGPGGKSRRIAAADFFTGLLSTALEPGEILTRIHLPGLKGRTGAAYVKLRNKASHYALVGVAAVVTLGDDGKIGRVALGVTGATAAPFRAAAAEAALAGGDPGNGAIDHAAGMLSGTDGSWMEDLHGSEDYRRHMADVIARRAIRLAAQRARA